MGSFTPALSVCDRRHHCWSDCYCHRLPRNRQTSDCCFPKRKRKSPMRNVCC